MGLILNTLYFIIVSILLKSTIFIFGKNLTIKISIFMVLLSVKKFLIDLLRSNKWKSAFAILIFYSILIKTKGLLLYSFN